MDDVCSECTIRLISSQVLIAMRQKAAGLNYNNVQLMQKYSLPVFPA